MIDIYSYDMVPLSDFLAEYKELNTNNRFRPVAVGRYGIRTRESIYSKELAQDYSKNKLIYKDTLTVGMGSVQMDIGILTDDITYSVSPAYHTYRINGINCDYLRFCLQARNADMFERYKKRGSRQGKSIDLKAWLHYLIPVYEIDGQLQIVSTLHKIQSIIDDRMQQLQKLDDLVKARFVEMFGNPVNNPFGLRTKPMTEICEIIDGDRGKNYPAANDFSDSGYCLFLNAKNVTLDGFNFENCMYITKEKDETLRKGRLNRGDVVLTTRGTIGNLALYTDEIPFEHIRINSGMVILRMKKVVDAVYFIEHFKMQLTDIKEKIASGSAQPQLPISTMNQVQILLPEIEQQRTFSDFVKKIDKSKAVIQEALNNAQLLFDSLMQQYLA